jgi:hypothetical protein
MADKASKPPKTAAKPAKAKTVAPKATPKTAPAKPKSTAGTKVAKKAAAKAPAKTPAKAAKPETATKTTTKGAPKTLTEQATPKAPRKADAVVLPAVTVEDLRRLEQEQRELPQEYGETKIVLMIRDPEWIFAYWEIDPATRARHGIPLHKHNRQLALRVIELGDRDEVLDTYDVAINDYTSSWYVKIRNSSSRYIVELGLQDDAGEFSVITTSNEVRLPRRTISEAQDIQFAEVTDEIYDQLVHLSGGTRIRERLGSDEFLRSLQERVTVSLGEGALFSGGLSSGDILGLSSSALQGMSSSLFSGLLSSSSLLSSGLFSGGLMLGSAGGEADIMNASSEKRGKGFWLEVGVDVIVYGATEPDAKVRLMGQDIELNADGTFRLRIILPDTTIEFPVEATSADGTERRAVKPVVRRHTEGDPRKPL